MFSYLQQLWTNVCYFWYENTYLSSRFSVVWEVHLDSVSRQHIWGVNFIHLHRMDYTVSGSIFV